MTDRILAKQNGVPSLQSRVVQLDTAKDHGGKRQRTDLIVWHCTGGDTADAAMEWLNSDGATASYHYLIDKDGTIKRFCPPDLIAYHAGVSSWPKPPVGKVSVNSRSLGVAFANDNGTDTNAADDALTKEQIESGLWLGVTLMKLYRIQPFNNVGHLEVSPGRKHDPAPHILNMQDWRERLGAAL